MVQGTNQRLRVAAGSLAAAVWLATPGVGFSQTIVAHRGASHDAPENTLAAFELAWQQGSDAIEGDFYVTADDHIVCIHDADTERTTDAQHRVEEATWDQLRHLDAGRWKGERWEGCRIPLFEEVLETIPPDKLFVIELKSKEAIVPVLAEELRRLGALDRRLLIISFDAETIRRCKQALPSVRAHWLTGFKRREGDAEFRPTAAEIAETVRRCGADGVGMKGQVDVIDPQFVDELRAGGCEEFHVWTIDSPHDARYFQRLGAIAITTNRPAKIRQAIETR